MATLTVRPSDPDNNKTHIEELMKQPWYHGLLPRDDIRAFLRENGDFLVRMSEPSAPGRRELVLSVMFDKNKEKIKHFVVNKSRDGKYSIEKYSFDSVTQLVNHHLAEKTSITSQKEVIIRNPIGRRAWELHHDDITLDKKLGEGAFGEVYKGTLTTKPKGRKVAVAIKQAKLDVMTKEQIKEIMREARLMRFFDHPHIVKLYGVAALGEPLMLLMELAANGALDSFLQKNNLAPEKKLEMCVQAAWGIEYLHEKNCLHRDIAARNCLYGDGKVKISDFGLSRSGTVYQMDPKKRVPIRWLAPETLRTAMYTQKTDVFSFGILCWEILNNGQEPYPDMTVAEVNVRVKEGYRMPLPPFLGPDSSHLIEIRCWSDNPNDRFTMAEISKSLERFTKIVRPDFTASSSSKKQQSKSLKSTISEPSKNSRH